MFTNFIFKQSYKYIYIANCERIIMSIRNIYVIMKDNNYKEIQI